MKLLSLLLFASIFAMNGLELTIKMENRPKPDDVKSKNTMIISKEKKKDKIRELISMSKDDSEKQMIWFLKPAKDKGISFLKIEYEDKDDLMKMWLPGFKRFKRIAASDKSDSFMGSDLSFEDLTNRNINDYTYKIIDSKKCEYSSQNDDKKEMYSCYILESIPNEIDTEYSKHITTIIEIEKDIFISIKEDSYDSNNELLKTKNIKYGNFDSLYIMNYIFVENVQKKSSTKLTVNNISINNNFSNDIFIERSLKTLP